MELSTYFALLDEASPLALTPYTTGRKFRGSRILGLADCGLDGLLRFDAAARITQDIAAEDLTDSGLDHEGVWVVRKTHIRFIGAPRYQDRLAISTFCAGVGRAWAQRRTTLSSQNGRVEVSSLWVQTDPQSRSPKSLSDNFYRIFGASAAGRTVGQRLEIPEGLDFENLDWPARITDIDILEHVNNAAYFEAVEQIANRNRCPRPDVATLFVIAEYREGVGWGEKIDLHVSQQSSKGFQLDFLTQGKNQCSIVFGILDSSDIP